MALAFARRSTIVAVLSAWLVTGAGCSLMFTVPVPPVEERGPIVHCTESTWAPVLDLVGVGLSVARTVVAFSATQPLDDLNTGGNERDPWLTPDGKTLYFTSDRGGMLTIYTAAVKPR